MADNKPVVYILYGDDEYAIAQYVAAMYARLGEPSTADLNFTRLDGRTAGDNDLRTATGAIPFLAERRIVVLNHPFARQPEAGKKTERSRYQEDFIRLIEGLPETTALVLTIDDQQRRGDWETMNANHWLLQWAGKAEGRALATSFALPTGTKMLTWVIKTAKAQGGEFSQQAAATLTDLVGSDTRLAALEIDKALSYVNRTRPVESKDIELLTARIDQPDVFALVDALGARNGPEASRRLHILLAEQDWLSIFGMVARQFRLLLLAREVIERGGGENEVAGELRGEPFRVAPFIARKLVQQANRFTLAGLEDVYRRLLALDETLKSSQMDPSVALDLFIADLAG